MKFREQIEETLKHKMDSKSARLCSIQLTTKLEYILDEMISALPQDNLECNRISKKLLEKVKEKCI